MPTFQDISFLRRFIKRFQQRKLYYISDSKNWSFSWDAHYITKEIKNHFHVRSKISLSPKKLKNANVLFGNRYAFFDLDKNQFHPSNSYYLIWFHGDLSDPENRYKKMIQQLKKRQKLLEKIIVPCQITYDGLHNSGIPHKKLALIPIGVDLSLFNPSTESDQRKCRAQIKIGTDRSCIGLFQKDGKGWEDGNEPKLEKGPDVFLESIAEVKKEISNLAVLLTGPARGYIKNGLDQLEIPYIHHNFENYHHIIPFFYASDICVIPSRCEGGPKALLEAWATGTPVVSTQVGMATDLIQHEKNGMLSPSGNPRHLAQNIITLLKNRELRKKCRAQALQDVQSYSWPKVAEKYYELIYQ